MYWSHRISWVGRDPKHHPVQVVPRFLHSRRLLVSQLQEEKQHHEEEVEGLHLDIRSLKQLSQQQAALIQDLQRHQGQEGLQHHVVRLKEENWVRGGEGAQQDRAGDPHLVLWQSAASCLGAMCGNFGIS